MGFLVIVFVAYLWFGVLGFGCWLLCVLWRLVWCGLLFRFASAGLVAICLVLVGFVWFVVCNLCFVFGCLLVCGGFWPLALVWGLC